MRIAKLAAAGGGAVLVVWLFGRHRGRGRAALSGLELLAATNATNPTNSSTATASDTSWPVRVKSLKNLARVVRRPSFQRKVAAARAKVAGAADVPLPFLLSWISHESGGQVSADTGSKQHGGSGLSSLDEHGFFQISREEAETIGLTAAQHMRLKYDEVYSLEQGIRLVMYYRQRAEVWLRKARTLWSPETTPADYWSFVKLFHAGGAGGAACVLRSVMAELGRPPAGFAELHRTACQLIDDGRLPDPRGRENCGLPGTVHGRPLAKLVLDNAALVGGVLLSGTRPVTLFHHRRGPSSKEHALRRQI